ncbi:MAG: valine--tRNA ligase [Ferruginibacter sp.]
MELSKNFEPTAIEATWYEHWMNKGYFSSTPDHREAYTIVMPPPNVTGVLHMGHCLNNTIQDILIRRARMEGKNACWVPGTDHASIATEAKVVGMLRERGIAKSSLSREAFLDYAWEWKEKYGGIILQQLRKLGCSADWNRTTFTMDPHYYDAVIDVFIALHQQGLIYRGKRMIHWDVKALTALSDEEVVRKETKQKLYFLKYFIEDNDDFITVATVRPETIMGDTAVCVHPDDERYKHLHGKKVIVPLINRLVPVIGDDYVTMEFGTGALKVTPAHDTNDYMLGQKHGLDIIDVFNDDGTMSAEAQLYIGEDRFAVRKKIAVELDEKNYLIKTEEYTSEVGYSERTDVVVEPRLSMQWWLNMKDLSAPALEVVLKEEIQFFPPKFRNIYRHWMENIKDWCISRQLWWGQRIPAWYDTQGRVVVAKKEEEAFMAFEQQHGYRPDTLKQDEDCLDTWFSSWLWPFEVFKGYSDSNQSEWSYYYPTQTLVTGPDIIFFWVARMIMAGLHFKQEIPFKEVYFTGTVRDKMGRKMSKSLGNSPDLLALIDQYGADATRFGIMIASPAGNDILFDEAALEQGRHFNNKMWNALKLIKGWEARVHDSTVANSEAVPFAINWFEQRLAKASKDVELLMRQFRLSEALKYLYSLIWDDFCSWYLEWVKPGFEMPVSAFVLNKTIAFYTELMQLLHPFMPFVTEEIYQRLEDRDIDLCVRTQPKIEQSASDIILSEGALLQSFITAIRDIRNKQQIKPKEPIDIFIQSDVPALIDRIQMILQQQTNAQSIAMTSANIEGAFTTVVDVHTCYIISSQPVDAAKQREDLEKEMVHLVGFLGSVEKKLSNERFVQQAKPEVVALEQKKRSDAIEKIDRIRQQLDRL